MNEEIDIEIENITLSKFSTDSNYLAIVEATLDTKSFTETIHPKDQAISKFAMYKNLLMSIKLYESLKKVSYKRLTRLSNAVCGHTPVPV